MHQLVSSARTGPAERRRALGRLLDAPALLIAPGVFDGLSAAIAAEAGAAAVYVSGGAVARSAGVPDLGLLSFAEVRDRVRDIVQAVDVPVIADADTGYGGVFNVMRTVAEFEEIGVAALHLEDQAEPKRCGHYAGKRLVDPVEMAAKLAAARRARRDDGLLLIARTDAIAVEGFDAAITRAEMYARCGADLLFVEAPQTTAQVEQIPRRLARPVIINMFAGGRTPLIGADRLATLGYRAMIVPSDLQRAAVFAMRETVAALLRDGCSTSVDERMVSFTDRERLVGLPAFAALEEEFVSAAVPEPRN